MNWYDTEQPTPLTRDRFERVREESGEYALYRSHDLIKPAMVCKSENLRSDLAAAFAEGGWAFFKYLEYPRRTELDDLLAN